MISKVTITGVKDLSANLKKLDINLSKLSQPLKSSAEFMKLEANRNFSAKGATFGETWLPLTERTKKIKERLGYGSQPMMVRTGLLKSAFWVDGPYTTKLGGNVKVLNPIYYAPLHQEGVGRLPRRVLLKLAKKQVDEITRIFVNWVTRQVRQSFKK